MKVCLWINRIETFCERTTIVDKICLTGDSYFGGTELGRKVAGTFMLCGDRIRQVVDATLGLIHLQGHGNLVTISTNDAFPEPPYLLTDNLELKCVFDGPAILRHVSRDNAVIECSSGISIVAPDWFGFAFSENDRTRLVAFSDLAVSDLTAEKVYAPFWEIAPEQSIERPILIEMTNV